MAKIHVRAKQMCYRDHKRIREGGTFHTEGDVFKDKSGKIVLPPYLEYAVKKVKAEPDLEAVVYEKNDEVI